VVGMSFYFVMVVIGQVLTRQKKDFVVVIPII